MAKNRFGGNPIDLEKGELLNARLQNLFQFPLDPFEGQVIYRSDLKIGAYYTGVNWLFFGLSEEILAALTNANAPDEANPFATLDDIPIVPEDLIDLADTPNAYTGAGGKVLAVKVAEDGVEFIILVGIPAGGAPGQILGKVGADDFAIGWVDPPDPGTSGITDVFAGTGISIDKTDPANPIISATGGGPGPSGPYLTDLDTFPVLKFDKNYRYVHTMVGALAISSELVTPVAVLGNFCKLYIKANGVNKPTFSSEFEIVWDNWANAAGSWNRILAEYTPEGKILTQIEQASVGTAGGGTGLTVITLTFEENYVLSHVITGSVQIQLDDADAEVGFRTILYFKADGVNKPFWSSDFVVTYDNYVNEAGVWNRFFLEYRPENKVLTNIINI